MAVEIVAELFPAFMTQSNFACDCFICIHRQLACVCFRPIISLDEKRNEIKKGKSKVDKRCLSITTCFPHLESKKREINKINIEKKTSKQTNKKKTMKDPFLETY